MPRSDEIDPESGIGCFRDTWLIRTVPVIEAREMVAAERRLAEVIGQLAEDEDDFERLAGIAEAAAVDDPGEELTADQREALAEVVSDFPNLGGLELGVAGLVHALATVRILPAASCRSHPDRSWSDAPVVLFAATEYRANALQSLAAASGCAFDIDVNRPNLLVVRGRSIANTMTLAEAVMENRKSFVQHRPQRPRLVNSAPQSTQGSLF